MTPNPPPDLIARARQILLPLVATEIEREALLTEAFYLQDPLLYSIDRAGAPKVFAVNLIRKLLERGTLGEGEHALARLLQTARYDCGVDKHAEIDALIAVANALCQVADQRRAESPPAAPVAMPTPLQTIATPRDERRPTVFISYAYTDDAAANRLVAALSTHGHACWIDTSEIKGGDEWAMTIADGIINSYALVPVITPASLRSKWVWKEILWAQQRNKRIVPWILENVLNEREFFPLVDCQGVTLFESGYDAALQKLLRSLPSPSSLAAESQAEAAAPAFPAPNPRAAMRKAELAYLERLRLEELLNTEKYTPLAGASQQRQPRAEMRAVFELLPMGKERQLRQEPRRFENAVDEMRRLRRAVLLGEPGAGKTTTIWKLAAELVAAALEDRAAPIPLLVRLGRWTEGQQSLPAFIAAQLGDLGDHLDLLLQEERAALLLDGLNELPASQHPAKYTQVQRFIEQHSRLMAVVSCRELDYMLDLGFDHINITPLDPIRIREFAVRYLEEKKGEALFWKLAGEAAQDRYAQFMKELSGKLADPEKVFWLELQLPDGIHWGWWKDDNSRWQDWLSIREAPSSLMVLARNPYMLLMLTSVYDKESELPKNRGELFRLFVEELLDRERRNRPETEQAALAIEHAELVEPLAQVAFEMQIRRANDQTGDALTVLTPKEVSAILSERQLYLAGSASILSIGKQVRFTHQLLQEYFAARCMELKIQSDADDEFKARDIWLSERWWNRTNWEEAAILLAGLYSNDCSKVVEWVAKANPEVAAQCIVRSGAALADATRERLRAEWISRLTDLQDDPRPQSRAAVGRALGLTGWDNRKGVGTVEVAIGSGRSIALPDIDDWVEIPGGEFKYGDESEGAKPQKLTLPTFYISRYPVTYAQFQTFLDDPEGYADARWFAGLAASDDERRMAEQAFKFANHPRETVNWYQALAFCRWLSWRRGGGYDLKKIEQWAVRLPTEFEWEKAARGLDGRLYPYGNDFDAAKGNTDETGIGQTSAVGIFPNGASPDGVMDMSGNVWEWCLSSYDKPALDARKESLRTKDNRVLRGGAWWLNLMFARSVFRDVILPAFRFNSVGFRVVGGRPPSS